MFSGSGGKAKDLEKNKTICQFGGKYVFTWNFSANASLQPQPFALTHLFNCASKIVHGLHQLKPSVQELQLHMWCPRQAEHRCVEKKNWYPYRMLIAVLSCGSVSLHGKVPMGFKDCGPWWEILIHIKPVGPWEEQTPPAA